MDLFVSGALGWGGLGPQPKAPHAVPSLECVLSMRFNALASSFTLCTFKYVTLHTTLLGHKMCPKYEHKALALPLHLAHLLLINEKSLTLEAP